MRRRHERIGRRDDFAGDPQCLKRRDQSNRGVGEQCDVLDPKVLAQLLFELLMKGSAVGEDLALPDLPQIGNELLETRKIGSRDVNRLHLFRFNGWNEPGDFIHGVFGPLRCGWLISKDSGGKPSHQRRHICRSAHSSAATIKFGCWLDESARRERNPERISASAAGLAAQWTPRRTKSEPSAAMKSSRPICARIAAPCRPGGVDPATVNVGTPIQSA